MAEIITKYSDYAIQSIEFFIQKIKDEMTIRDLSNLTHGRIKIIPVLKEHPLVVLTQKVVDNQTRSASDRESGVLPSIAVLPGNMPPDGFTFSKSPKTEIIEDEYINELKALLDLTDKEIQQQGLITKEQINLILSTYKRNPENSLLLETKEYHRDEEINISVWAESADITNLLTILIDSVLTEIQIGDPGDNSAIKKMSVKVHRGLNNIRFGRTLHGTEFSLTFLNTFVNYVVKLDPRVTDVEHDFTFRTPGDDNEH